jgi:hypothetical protein
MPLNPGQQVVSASEHRFKVVIAGRRWGKTWLATRSLARAVREPNRRAWYIAPSYRMARQIVWDALKWRLQDLKWVQKINDSELTITLRNNSTISLRGADNPDSLRGVGLDFVVMDEFAMIDEKAWTEVLRPTLSDRNGSAMFISTPMGTSNWAYDLYNRAQSDPAWSSWTFRTIDGGNVSAEEIEQARRDLSDRQFRQEYEATFETYSGRIYYNFDRTRNLRKFESEVPREILVFADFNVNPISAAVAVETGRGIHIIDEIVIYGSNTDELADEIRNRYPTQSVKVYPDPAGVQRKTSAGGRTDITILENAKFRVFYHRNHPAVRDRINAVNAALLSADETVSLWIDPKCRTVIECLEKQLYKEGTQIPDKDGGYDHMNDAIGYGVEYLRPLRREREPVAQPRGWGHQSSPGWRS